MRTEIVVLPDGTEVAERTVGKVYASRGNRGGVPVVREKTAAVAQQEADAGQANEAAEAADLAARRYTVRKITVVRRIQAAGFAEAARTYRAANPDLEDLWQAAGPIKGDDPQMVAFLVAIGADPDVILAPEGTP